MQKYKFNSLVIASILVILCAISSFAQQPTLTKKQSLILEFRRLTGADHVNMSVNFTTEDVRDSLSAIVEKDPELTDTQKQELRKSVADAYAPIDKIAKDFFADKPQINQLTEDVMFKLYDTTFDEAELGVLIAFYRTPVGQKAAPFLPTLSNAVQKGFVTLLSKNYKPLFSP